MESYPVTQSGGGAAGFFYFLYVAIAVLLIVSMWRVFTKAGKPGWAAIIPIYNMVVLLEITGKPIWWIVLFLLPIVNMVVSIIVTVELADRFGQSGGFAVGLILLPFIFYPILAFGSATYRYPGQRYATPPGGAYAPPPPGAYQPQAGAPGATQPAQPTAPQRQAQPPAGASKRCKFCGSVISADTLFCANCGKRVE